MNVARGRIFRQALCPYPSSLYTFPTSERDVECAMRRSFLNWLIDFALFVAVLGLLLTGLLIEFILPPGSHGDAVWSLSRHAWGEIHFWFAVAMIAVALLHVILHWGWVCTVAMKLLDRTAVAPKRLQRHVAGAIVVALLLLIVGGFLLAAARAKTVDPRGDGPGSIHRDDGSHDQDLHLPPQNPRNPPLRDRGRGRGRGGGI